MGGDQETVERASPEREPDAKKRLQVAAMAGMAVGAALALNSPDASQVGLLIIGSGAGAALATEAAVRLAQTGMSAARTAGSAGVQVFGRAGQAGRPISAEFIS